MERLKLSGKNVSILGMARSGKALAMALTDRGARVFVSDAKPQDKLKDVMEELAGLPLEWETGGHTERVYKGKDLIIISPGVSIYSPIVQDAKKAGVTVISEVEMAYLMAKAPFIAITGTNGKSTTSTLSHLSMLAAGRKSYLAGNIGTPLVGEVGRISQDAWIVAEISSFQLEAVEEFRPRIAALLNVTTDHIDRHGSFENYKLAKASIFKKQKETDFAVLNTDDPAVMSVYDMIPSRKLLFSRKSQVDEGAYFEDGKIITVFNGVRKIAAEYADIKLKGIHNLENILAVMCISMAAGEGTEPVLKAVNEFKPLHFRMEYVDTVLGRKFYNDSKGTNPDAVRASLESFAEPVVIIAGGTDKGLDFMPLAENIAKYAKGAVLIGESREKIAESLNKIGFNNINIIDDFSLNGFKEAMKSAMLMAPEGGVVLLSPSCASFDMFNNAEHRGEMFNQFTGELKKEHEKNI